jgi:hypothetical protein
MATPASTAQALTALRQRLDDTAAALARADLAQLLACEAQLQDAVAALNTIWPTVGDPSHLREELTRIRASVARYRRLGGSLLDFVHTSLDGIGREPAAFTFRHSA